MKQRALPTATQQTKDSHWDYIQTHQKLCHIHAPEWEVLIITESIIYAIYVRESMPVVFADTHLLFGSGEPVLNMCSTAC